MYARGGGLPREVRAKVRVLPDERIPEHYGRAGLGTNETVKAATSQCIKTLGEEANIRAGVRRMLATRAFVAAARSGCPRLHKVSGHGGCTGVAERGRPPEGQVQHV